MRIDADLYADRSDIVSVITRLSVLRRTLVDGGFEDVLIITLDDTIDILADILAEAEE